MERIFRLILTSIFVSMLAACAGESGGGSGDDEDEINGEYSSDAFVVDLLVSNTANPASTPAEATCEGSIDIVVDLDAEPQVSGEGDCLMPSNAASYTVSANFVDEASFEGEIVFLFNTREHVVPFEGEVVGDDLEARYEGQTDATAIIVIDWNGEFDARKEGAEDDGPGAGGTVNGEYEGDGSFEVTLEISDTRFPDNAPSIGECVGSIELLVDDAGNPDVAGEGTCFLPNNVISYTLEGDLVDGDEWEGEITLVLNNRAHDLAIEGEIEGDEITGTFAGQTNATAILVIDWDGGFSADLLDD